MLEIYIKVEQRGQYRIEKVSESGLLGLSDTLKINDIDICHKREFSKMQMCEGVQTKTYMDFSGLVLRKLNMEP